MGGFFKANEADVEVKKIELGALQPVIEYQTSAKKVLVVAPTLGDIIKKLTAIRQANYNVWTVNTITETDYPLIESLMFELGNKILKANNPELDLLHEAKHQFAIVMEALFKNKNKFVIVSFAAQLLQYFTIICDKDFTSGTSLHQFRQFLDNNAERFGTVNTNLFVTEYKLIKIYNDLVAFTDSVTGRIAPTKNLLGEIEFLLEELNLIKIKIDQWLLDAPDNIFIHYLDFSLNYCCAKAIELQFHLQEKSLTVEDNLYMSVSQEIFLKAAKNSLGRIDEIQDAAYERDNSKASGMEYSLGQNVLIKLPVADSESLNMHMSNLLR